MNICLGGEGAAAPFPPNPPSPARLGSRYHAVLALVLVLVLVLVLIPVLVLVSVLVPVLRDIVTRAER